MNVLYILDSEFPYQYGGIETYLFNLAKSLKTHHNTTITIFSMKGLKKRRFFDMTEIGTVRNLGLLVDTKKAYLLPCKLARSSLKLLMFILCCLCEGRKANADVVHAVGSHGSWIAGILLKLFYRKPLIITFHGQTSLGQKIHFQEVYKKDFLANLIYLITCLLERIVRKKADKVISLHPVIKEHDDVIPQGIDAHDFYLAPDNKREIIFVGRLTPIKGIPILLKAMLALKDLDVHLTLIGDGPDKEMIENFMIQNGLVEKITLYGETDRVNEVLSKGGIFVLPSLFEGFPLSMLEAMCSGLPAIATRVGALPYFFKSGQDCIMIEPNSVTQLTQAIRLMYENDKLRNAIRLSGRERITKEFSWDIVSTKVFQVYTHAISTKTKNV